jgi:hypothetical protein
LTTNTSVNVTSISLTAGDWDVEGSVGFIPNASTVLVTVIGGIGTTSATFPADPGAGGKFVLQGTAGTGVSTGDQKKMECLTHAGQHHQHDDRLSRCAGRLYHVNLRRVRVHQRAAGAAGAAVLGTTDPWDETMQIHP